MGVALVMLYPTQILYWAQSKGWIIYRLKHVICLISITSMIYVAITLLACGLLGKDFVVCIIPIAAFGFMRMVIYYAEKALNLD